MKRKSKEAVTTVFFVKNDRRGQLFLKQLKEHLNCGWRLIIRGRNENRAQYHGREMTANNGYKYYLHRVGLRQSVPLACASYFAVYIRSPRLDDRTMIQWRAMYGQINKLEAEAQGHTFIINELGREVAYLQEHVDMLKYLLQREKDEGDKLGQHLHYMCTKVIDLERKTWRKLWEDLKLLVNQRVAKWASR